MHVSRHLTVMIDQPVSCTPWRVVCNSDALDILDIARTDETRLRTFWRRTVVCTVDFEDVSSSHWKLRTEVVVWSCSTVTKVTLLSFLLSSKAKIDLHVIGARVLPAVVVGIYVVGFIKLTTMLAQPCGYLYVQQWTVQIRVFSTNLIFTW